MLEEILEHFDSYSYLIIFLGNLIDSFPLVGIVVPEELLIALGGFSASQGKSLLLLVLTVSFFGMLIGQLFMYKVGQRHGEELLQVLRVSGARRDKLERYLKKNQLWLNVVSRFSSSLRAVIALISGLRRFSFKKFVAIEIVASLIKSLGYGLLGFLVAESVEQLDLLVVRIGILFMVIIIVSFVVSVYTSRRVLFSQRYGGNEKC